MGGGVNLYRFQFFLQPRQNSFRAVLLSESRKIHKFSLFIIKVLLKKEKRGSVFSVVYYHIDDGDCFKIVLLKKSIVVIKIFVIC